MQAKEKRYYRATKLFIETGSGEGVLQHRGILGNGRTGGEVFNVIEKYSLVTHIRTPFLRFVSDWLSISLPDEELLPQQ